MLTGFMPAMMLTGFIFDLRNTPAIIQIIGHLLPATHYMDLTKTLFLAGDNTALAAKDCAILAGFAAVLLFAVTKKLRKRL